MVCIVESEKHAFITLFCVIVLVSGVYANDRNTYKITDDPVVEVGEPVKCEYEQKSYMIYQDIDFLGSMHKEKGDMYVPCGKDGEIEGRMPAMLLIHGGAMVGGDKSQHVIRTIAKEIVADGYVVFSIDYSLAMLNADLKNGIQKEISWPRNLYDCKTAVRFMRMYADKFHIDPERIGVLGESAGAYLAVMVGYTCGTTLDTGGFYKEYPTSVNCVIGFYTPVLPAGIWHEFFFDESTNDIQQQIKLASPLNYVSHGLPATLLIHGTNDKIVDILNSRKLSQRLEENEVENELVEIDGGGHGFNILPDKINNNTDLRPQVLGFLEKNLRQDKSRKKVTQLKQF